jgi:hypothetical protein
VTVYDVEVFPDAFVRLLERTGVEVLAFIIVSTLSAPDHPLAVAVRDVPATPVPLRDTEPPVGAVPAVVVITPDDTHAEVPPLLVALAYARNCTSGGSASVFMIVVLVDEVPVALATLDSVGVLVDATILIS